MKDKILERVTQAQIRKAKELLAKGVSIKQVAEITGLSITELTEAIYNPTRMHKSINLK